MQLLGAAAPISETMVAILPSAGAVFRAPMFRFVGLSNLGVDRFAAGFRREAFEVLMWKLRLHDGRSAATAPSPSKRTRSGAFRDDIVAAMNAQLQAEVQWIFRSKSNDGGIRHTAL